MGTRNVLCEPPSQSSQGSCSASYLRQGCTGRRHTPSVHCWVFLPHESLFRPQHTCNNEDLLKCVCVKAVCKDPCFHSFVTSTITHNISPLLPSQKAYVFLSLLVQFNFFLSKSRKGSYRTRKKTNGASVCTGTHAVLVFSQVLCLKL